MPDITVISAALTSIKTATDIAKALKAVDLSMEKADLKIQLAGLMEALADTKVQLLDLREVIATRDARIAELEEAFAKKHDLVRAHDAYYHIGSENEPTGRPHCLRCWEVEHKLYTLASDPREHRSRICTACGTLYTRLATPELPR